MPRISVAIADAIFATALAMLVCHEMDAVAAGEWQLLPLLSQLEFAVGYHWFVWLHVPLFALIFWCLLRPAGSVRRIAQQLVAAFIVVHVGLHMAFSQHDLYNFHSFTSQALIFGGGLFAAVYLVVSFGQDDRASGP